MGSIFLLAPSAAIYPTLRACVVVILLLPRPERLLLGFCLGAMAMSVTCGLIIVFTLGGSSGATTTFDRLGSAIRREGVGNDWDLEQEQHDDVPGEHDEHRGEGRSVLSGEQVHRGQVADPRYTVR
jgi:hypothetical protein